MIDVKKLKEMVFQGRINDLLELLERESKYTNELTENIPKTEDEKVARGDALDHLNFLSRFGLDKEKVIEGNMVYSARKKEFTSWLDMGAPGIEPSELKAYLDDNPIKERNNVDTHR